MRSYFKVVELLKNHLIDNPDVNTVMHGAFSEADYAKKNIYPLAVINPVSSDISNGQINQFTFEIGCFDKRDISKSEVVDKFVSNDNEIDNLNTTHAVLNKLVNYLRLLYNDDNINLVSASNLVPLIFDNINVLDGWGLTLTLEIPSTVDAC